MPMTYVGQLDRASHYADEAFAHSGSWVGHMPDANPDKPEGSPRTRIDEQFESALKQLRQFENDPLASDEYYGNPFDKETAIARRLKKCAQDLQAVYRPQPDKETAMARRLRIYAEDLQALYRLQPEEPYEIRETQHVVKMGKGEPADTLRVTLENINDMTDRFGKDVRSERFLKVISQIVHFTKEKKIITPGEAEELFIKSGPYMGP